MRFPGQRFFQRDLWSPELMRGGGLRAFLVRTLRIATLAFQDLWEGRLTLRAGSLVYTTLLSLVPLLAVSFSVLKSLGAYNWVEPALLNFLAPLGPKGQELSDRILGFVANIRVGVLGSVGLALLLYTVISLIQQVEDAFNTAWRVRRARSFARRFSDYLSVLLVGPVLIVAAIGFTASITSNALVQRLLAIEPFGTAVVVLSAIAPYLFVIGAFTFIYVFVPNTRVRFRSALVGGVVAGILWQSVGLMFASFAAGSTRYDAIYSSFAILILFMIWLYVNWLILLLGGQIAYYHQHPEQLQPGHRRLRPSNRFREQLALAVLSLVTHHFYRNGKPWTLESLVHRLQVPGDLLDEVVAVLEREGFLVETGDEQPGFYPARPPEIVALAEVVERVRASQEGPNPLTATVEADPTIHAVSGRIEAGVRQGLDGMTLKDLVGIETTRE